MNTMSPDQQNYQKEDQNQQQRGGNQQQQQPQQQQQQQQQNVPAQQPMSAPGTAQQQQRPPISDTEPMIIEEKVQMVNGESAVKKYERGPLLGKGGFAKCFQITNIETKKIMAAKIIPKNTLVKNRARQKLVSEIKIHKSLHHNNVVKFEHVFEDQENVYILLELCPHQTLNELIKRRKRITELETLCYTVQIVQALKYLHTNRVIHRDLKLGNLFIGDRMEIKLGDFGLATRLEFPGEKKRTICGTPNYIAPEILDGRVGHSYEVDVWSLGVIIYTLLIGKPPFETSEVKKTYGRIKAGQYSFPDHSPIPDTAKALIQLILQQDPTKRPSLDDILAHPFINNGGTIPKLLPVTLLQSAPTPGYLKPYAPSPMNAKARSDQNMIKNPTVGLIKPNGQGNDLNYYPDDKKNLPTNQFASSGNLHQNNKGSFVGNPVDLGQKDGSRPSTTQGSNLQQQQPGNGLQQGMPTSNRYQSVQQLGSVASANSRSQQSQQPYHQQQSTLPGSTAESQQVIDGNRNNLWVAQYVDYTSKYGLGYLLSSGSSGVIFNDGTKIVLDPKGTYLEYIYKKENEEITDRHSISEFPPEIQKKVTLLQHFRNYLVTESTKKMLSETDQNGASNSNPAGNGNSGGNGAVLRLGSNYQHQPDKPLPYLKKWMQTRHAIMFRLSNKIVQVLFSDKTEILLNSQDKIVSFMNRRGERSHYPLADAMASNNVDMTKRLRYTKDILVHLLRNNNNRNQNPADYQGQPGTEPPFEGANDQPNPTSNNNNNIGISGSAMENEFPRMNSGLAVGGAEAQRGMQAIYSQKSLSDKDRQKTRGDSNQYSQQQLQQLPGQNTANQFMQQQQSTTQLKK